MLIPAFLLPNLVTTTEKARIVQRILKLYSSAPNMPQTPLTQIVYEVQPKGQSMRPHPTFQSQTPEQTLPE